MGQAIGAFLRVFDLHRAVGQERHAAQAACNLGCTLGGIGRFEDAIRAFTHALVCFQWTGDRHGEAGVRTHLAIVLRTCCRAKEAAETVRRGHRPLPRDG
ncbi:tetratricopeptide repeat protein [Streptomyces sp. NPDC046942]|uniref:tetratricopeptide repeat protein n=1 Tax=Streptomyces sp. NPDC046942 TaxID=3155137 RepID=UPI0033C97464